jgi:hypothetical protein
VTGRRNFTLRILDSWTDYDLSGVDLTTQHVAMRAAFDAITATFRFVSTPESVGS